MKSTRVVVPSFHESARLPTLLAEIRTEPPPPFHDIRYLLVDDGSGQEERVRLRGLIGEYELGERVSLLCLERNRGKGGAIRAGFERCLVEAPDYLAFMDADGAVPVSQLHRAIRHIAWPGSVSAACVVGSRVRMLGRTVQRSAARHYLGRLFATFVSAYYGVPVYDSQCGLKVFRRDAIERYLDAPTDSRWVWDTQLLLALVLAGESVRELPIDWREVEGSKVSPLRDFLPMVARLIASRDRLTRAGGRHGY